MRAHRDAAGGIGLLGPPRAAGLRDVEVAGTDQRNAACMRA
jgi:hypothetical protein